MSDESIVDLGIAVDKELWKGPDGEEGGLESEIATMNLGVKTKEMDILSALSVRKSLVVYVKSLESEMRIRRNASQSRDATTQSATPVLLQQPSHRRRTEIKR